MQRNKSIMVIGIITVAVIAIGGAAAYSYMSKRVPPEDELPDRLIVDNQKELPEVEAFLKKYPDASINVDRSGRLAVDYRVDDGTDNTASGAYLRLRVFADNQGRPQEMLIDCSDGKNSHLTYDNLINYIETETCLK